MTAPAGVVPDAASAAEYRRRGWWRDATFLDDLRRQARERPHRLAVAGRRVAAAHTDTLDYGELARLTERFAEALHALDVRRGEVVAVQLPNRWEMVPLIFACIRAGALICPISPICPPAELRHRLELTEAKVVVTVPEWSGEPLASIAKTVVDDLPAPAHVVVVDRADQDGTLGFAGHFVDVAREEDPRLPESRQLGADDPFAVLFTSGTTGESKGVVHSQNTIHSAIRGYVDALGLAGDFVAAVSTPLCHYSGFAQGILAGVLVGGTVAFQDERRNEVLLDLVTRYGATLLYGPPATVSDVCASQRAHPRDTRTLRHVVVGSAPVLQSLVDDIRDTLGARTYSLWGMTENGPVTFTRPEEPDDHAARSNGRPIDAMRIRIEPLDGVDHGVGRLHVRGASLSPGYHRRADLYAAEFSADGWFDTGDLARDDGHGGIRILGRARDAIVRSGAVAPVTELEAVIGGHPALREAAVLEVPGIPGGAVVAVVVPRRAARPALDEIRALVVAAGHDPRFLPERVEYVDALPKTLTGKVRKAELRRRYAVPAGAGAV
ncbi:cyclohexanecarboxylate-CoA ligase [Actinoplanes cyaneus]|uniref:Cyclohexanecarboxylate-CoA ligase n=1 Tax=Actinoplanes cyaneus TaxID=52696 RepID=A0A919M580_9ACTN|nr:AMP-binding protein [Actinoplanes cyaneus]MCW2137835.1 cyclohexanecarboxylate-CoA ligase [Actinoplanes cyaneus]GID64958.1 cyclohexanecarboxylate-CoA ligase [Actinoplanes cyaneus]